MTRSMQKALMKKDLGGIAANKRMLSVLLIVPLVMAVVLPSIILLSIRYASEGAGDLEGMLALLPESAGGGDPNQMLTGLILNHILPIFFLMIPVMASSVMAASSFVGEKERRTLETLFYCPMTLGEIFVAKVAACFLLGMAVSLLSFFAMILVVEAEAVLLLGGPAPLGLTWLAVMLLVGPALSLLAITLIVRGSAKAQTMEESQQRSVFLILPIVLLVAGQLSGLMLVNAWMLLALGAVLAAAALLSLRAAFARFDYETLLRG